MSAFFKEPEIVSIGVGITRIIILVVVFQVSQVIYMGCLRGAGDTGYTAMASIISVTIIRTAFSYLCGYALGLGINGVWMGILADQVSRFFFGSIRFRQGKWTKIKI
jgi:Na+-driven multidrug efflux pump